MVKRHLRVLLLLPLLAACGGGGGGGNRGSETWRVTLAAVTSDSCLGGHLQEYPGYVFVGDTGQDEQLTAVLAFDISSLPSWATHVTARLELTGWIPINVPAVTLGTLLVDAIALGPTQTLDDGACSSSPLQSALDTVTPTGAAPMFLGSWQAQVDAAVEADVTARRSRSAFRLRFAMPSDNDGVGEAVYFTPWLSPTLATLEITYQSF
jgi:hypothetical protein